jgi:hypothetical protein
MTQQDIVVYLLSVCKHSQIEHIADSFSYLCVNITELTFIFQIILYHLQMIPVLPRGAMDLAVNALPRRGRHDL